MNSSLTNTIPFSDDEIQRLRSETAGVRNVIHFNNAGAGLMPDVVTESQLEHIRLEASIGGYEAAALRTDEIKEFYNECGLLFNTIARNIAFAASATDAYTRALSSIPFSPGDVILTDRDDFVSNQIQFLSLEKRFKIEIIHIENVESGGLDVDHLREMLIKHKPKLLAITHIPTNSGLIQPVEAIAKVFEEFRNNYPNTWYILDACQSVGQLKLDVTTLSCDFLSVTCRKFLRGPRGTGALFVSDRALAAGLEPLFLDMRGAEWTAKNSYRQQPDAKRFEDWEFAYSTVIGTAVAIRYCRMLGEDRIRHRVQMLAAEMRTSLSEIDRVSVLDKGEDKGGLVTFHVAGANPVDLVKAFGSHKINVVPSYRAFAVMDFDEKNVAWAIRASPHYYNTREEIFRFLDVVREIM